MPKDPAGTPADDFDLDDDLQVSRNSLAILITGILVIVAGFVTYQYFSNRAATPEEGDLSIEQLQKKLDQQAGEKETPEVQPQEKGGIAGSSTTRDKEEGQGIGGPEPGVEVVSPWVANDISPNTITGGSYVVREGDTLWEIAEGRYGSGFEWTKILEANKDQIGFLADGSQALISPGQVLTLPN